MYDYLTNILTNYQGFERIKAFFISLFLILEKALFSMLFVFGYLFMFLVTLLIIVYFSVLELADYLHIKFEKYINKNIIN